MSARSAAPGAVLRPHAEQADVAELAALAVADDRPRPPNWNLSPWAVVVYLLVYAFTNLGAFAVVIAVSRTTRSGKISSFAGLINYAPGQAVLMTIFLASLAGIPPLGGWIAKFNVFRAVLDAGTTAAYVLAVIGAVNTAIAAAYYLRVMRTMWMDPPPEGADTTPVVTPAPVMAALGITAIGTVVLGVLPGLVTRFADQQDLAGAFGS